MLCVVFLIFALFGCDSNNNSNINNNININSSENFVINFNEQKIGDITADCSEQMLVYYFGQENIKTEEIGLDEGEIALVTQVFKNNPEKGLIIQWKDIKNKKYPKEIKIKGNKWHTENSNIKIGMTLKELESLNKKDFELLGFGWDYGGTVTDWKTGALTREAGNLRDFSKKRLVPVFALPEEYNTPENYKKIDKILGDSSFSSSNELMQKINPVIAEINIMWP